MSVYARFKREADGFRHLVELLETTPISRREKMITVGMDEDRNYTMRALHYLMTFEDVLTLPDEELAEVVDATPPRTLALAICKSSPDVRTRVLRCAKGPRATEIRDLTDEASARISLAEVGGAQLKVVGYARTLEKRGLVQAKKIPASAA